MTLAQTCAKVKQSFRLDDKWLIALLNDQAIRQNPCSKYYGICYAHTKWSKFIRQAQFGYFGLSNVASELVYFSILFNFDSALGENFPTKISNNELKLK